MDLLALLKWKAYPDRVMDILGRLRHVSGEEIVKVLHEITAFVTGSEFRPAGHSEGSLLLCFLIHTVNFPPCINWDFIMTRSWTGRQI